MPITIQEAIQANLKCFIKNEDQEQLDFYIKSRRKQLHGVILENDEMPDVIVKMNDIRKLLGRIAYPTRHLPQDGQSDMGSSMMQSNSMMSRQFFAFQGGKKNHKRGSKKGHDSSEEGSHVNSSPNKNRKR